MRWMSITFCALFVLTAQSQESFDNDYFHLENEILELESQQTFDVEVDESSESTSDEIDENIETLYRNWQLSLGSFYATFKKVQTSASGEEELPKPWTYLSTGIEIGNWGRFSVIPSVGFTFPKDGDDGSRRLMYFLRGDLAYRYSRLGLRLGTSIIFNRYSFSDSSPAKLRNGTSSSSFYRSDDANTSIQNTLDLTAEFEIARWVSLAGRYVGYSLFESEKRDNGLMIELLFFLDREDPK